MPGPGNRFQALGFNFFVAGHTFAVRALEICPDGRDHITRHMLALSTYLGHGNVCHTYWYLEAVPELMKNIAQRCESFFTGGAP